MLHLSAKGTPLLLPAAANASVEYKNPKLSDGIEDDYTLPMDLPVEGNEVALGHVHEQHLRDRLLELRPATLEHQGAPLHQGTLQVLGSTPDTIRASFSAQGFASLLKGVKLRTALAGNTIDTVATHGGLVEHAKAVTMVSTPHESHCFPLHTNKSLYGSANPHWQPSASAWSDSQAYAVDALVLWTEYTPVRRDWAYQCIDATTAGQSPETHPAKWRRVVFGVVNSYDADAEAYDENDSTGNFYAMVPWFRYDWVVRKALQYLGLEARGDWFRDHATKTLLLPNATALDAEARVGEWAARQTDPVTHEPGDYPARLPLDDDTTAPYVDPEDHYDPTALTFEVDAAGVHRFRVYVQATFSSPDQLALSVRRASDDSLALGPEGFPAVQATTVSSTTHAHLFEFSVLFEAGDVGEDFYLCAEAFNAGPFMAESTLANCWAASWQVSGAGVNNFQTVIDPAWHVPDIGLGEFLEAVASTFGVELVPELESSAVYLNIKERVLRPNTPEGSNERNRSQRTLDISDRLCGPVEMDHQRRLKGVRMSWPLNDAVQDEPVDSERRPVVDLESEAQAPNGPRQHCWVRSTRKLLRSVFDESTNTYVWQHQGYLLPARAVGETEDASELQPPIKPLPMEDIWVDGRRLLVPVLDQAGRSSFFATDSDSTDLHVCHNYGPVAAGEDEALYPAAGSWGMDAQAAPRWSLLLNEQPTGDYPDFWDHYHNRWWSALVRAVPVTLDLLLDHEFLRDRQRRNDLLHIHGHDHLMEALPVDYRNSLAPLVSRGAYLRRLVPEGFGSVGAKVYEAPCLHCGPCVATPAAFRIISNGGPMQFIASYPNNGPDTATGLGSTLGDIIMPVDGTGVDLGITWQVQTYGDNEQSQGTSEALAAGDYCVSFFVIGDEQSAYQPNGIALQADDVDLSGLEDAVLQFFILSSPAPSVILPRMTMDPSVLTEYLGPDQWALQLTLDDAVSVVVASGFVFLPGTYSLSIQLTVCLSLVFNGVTAPIEVFRTFATNIDGYGLENGYADFRNASVDLSADSAFMAIKASLEGKGWTVLIDP
jgi:hypothetical protein